MREPRYPFSRFVFVYRRSTGPPDARHGRGARGRLSIRVFLGAFRAEVRWSPAARAMVPCCLGAMVPRCHGATVRWCHGATVPRCHGTMAVPWCVGAMVPRCPGAMVSCCLGAMVPRCLAAAVPWCNSATVPWHHGSALVRWCHGAMVPRCPVAMVPWWHGAMVSCCLGAMVPRFLGAAVPWCRGATVPWCHGTVTSCLGTIVPWCHGAMVPRCTDIQLDKDTTMAGHYTSVGVRHWRRLQYCTRRSQKPLIAACLHAPTLFSALHRALMPHSESRKTTTCDAVVFRERPLDIVCLTVWNGTHATLEKQEANSGEVSSQHLVGFFKDGCTNLLWRQAAGWLDWIRIPLVRTSSELAVRRAGKAPEGTVPSPSPDRHASILSRRGSSSSSPPTVDGFGTGTPVPSPQSQSFSRSYGSILPTSLAYIVPSTRGCSPWRPDAVMSTTGRGRHSVLRIFKGRRERTGHHATCGALPAAGPYLRLSRFQGGQAVKQKR
ncbi:hypothetical protein CQW23_34791 [Capsicum baccatum]|uniref:Protein TAR1 n=1 Tax=Capsicum baccatum TaxID=33114 RepID=A0A2G2UXW7_CAPBA|nr:hypothetical protein CQW23_34791 [Capsicum baccatum]